MISEYFIDQCLQACVSQYDTNHRRVSDMMDSILVVINWYRENVNEDARPLEFREKFDLLSWCADKRKSIGENYSFEGMIEPLSHWKLSHYIPLLEEIRRIYSQEEFTSLNRMILNRRKVCEITKNRAELQKLLNDIDSCNLSDDEEVIRQWELKLTDAYENLVKTQKMDSSESVASLDIMTDSYETMFTSMMNSVDESKVLHTGFKFLADMLISRGFENRRLYMVGGSSGVGKSAMMINLICNAIVHNKPMLGGLSNTYLYITAENLIDETWIRFYCCLMDVITEDFASDIRRLKQQMDLDKSTGDEETANTKFRDFYMGLQKKVAEKLNEHKSNVIFKYVPSGTTTVELTGIIDSAAKSCEGTSTLRGCFIDYLDLFSSGKNLDYRFELSAIAQTFKNLAIEYDIPVITASQLNREGYDTKSEPKLTQMGESMGKVHISDFVLFLQEANPKIQDVGDITYRVVRATVVKQRNGKTGDTRSLFVPSSRGTRSVFTYRFKELNVSNLSVQQKESKQNQTNICDVEDPAFDDIGTNSLE